MSFGTGDGGNSTGAGSTAGDAGDVNITAGSGGFSSGGGDTGGFGGDIVLTAGDAGEGTTNGTAGMILFKNPTSFKKVVTAMTTTAGITTTAIFGGIITANQGAAGAATYTMPTGTALFAVTSGNFVSVGDSLTFSIVNISTNAAEDITVAGNTDMTAKGNMVVAANSSATELSRGTFTIVYKGGVAFDFYRIA